MDLYSIFFTKILVIVLNPSDLRQHVAPTLRWDLLHRKVTAL